VSGPGQLLLERGDALDHQLTQIWEMALGLKNITPTDDFFDLGGDSLAAATAFALIEKWLGVDLPISTLFSAGTVEKLAAIIRTGGWSSEDQRLLPFRLAGSRPALFCVPGAGAEALSVHALARHLGEQQPFFVFQHQGLSGARHCLRTVGEMAGQYIDALRQHQPQGPYHLFGFSYGGVVAFEMALRLIAGGQQVHFLGLLDAYGGRYPEVKTPLSLRNRVRLQIHKVIGLGENERLTWLHFKAAIRVTPIIWHARLLLSLPMLPRPHKLRHRCLREACLAARHIYPLRAYPGTLYLFSVEESLPSDLFETDPELGWRGIAKGGIRIESVPGRHRDFLREPHVATLAAKLAGALDEARAASIGQAGESPK
jgi:thioesterase domain-containing protein/acyl carrier protein